MVKIVAPAFYATDRPRLPLLASLAAIAATIAFNACYYRQLGAPGLALGTSLGALVNVGLLRLFFARKVGPLARPGRARELAWLLLANAVMGGALYAAWTGAALGLTRLALPGPLATLALGLLGPLPPSSASASTSTSACCSSPASPASTASPASRAACGDGSAAARPRPDLPPRTAHLSPRTADQSRPVASLTCPRGQPHLSLQPASVRRVASLTSPRTAAPVPADSLSAPRARRSARAPAACRSGARPR